MLYVIGITNAPEYIIKKVPRPGRDEYTAKVDIYYYNRIISTHKGLAPRISAGEAVADVAWEAMTILSYVYRHKLVGTIYNLLPRRRSGCEEYTFAPLPATENRNAMVHN